MTSDWQRRQRHAWAIATIKVTDKGPELAVAEQGLTYEKAVELADQRSNLTISGDHPDTGDKRTLTGVSPLVYRSEGDTDWIFAAVGWGFKDVQEVKADSTAVLVMVDGPGQ